ncbi:MAG: ribonuclease III [Clostridia bacterium]|nr:ribonuclease III [Clostridia bacterium]
MLTKEHLTELQNRIGYVFSDAAKLKRALMHSSYVPGEGGDNERMEFLGDAVLELCVSEELFFRFPKMQEGELTKNRASIVCEDALFRAAKEIGLGECLLLGRGEDASGGRKKPSILSDAFEAVIAAIFLDGGLEPAKMFIHRFVLSQLDLSKPVFEKDHKTRLQELIHARTHGKQVLYRLIGENGPDHDKTFTMQAVLDERVLGTGTGRSKQSAGQAAAMDALSRLETK